MEYTHSIDGSRCEVFLKGRFTFFDTATFAAIRELFASPGLETLVLNFKRVDFIDSAALGMLLLAKEEAETRAIKLVLSQPSRPVEKAFNVSAFHTFFAMKE